MKQLVIIIGTVILGALIFQMMVGDGPDTVKSTVSGVMRYNLQQYTQGG